jgi:hypothetical protein
MHENQWKASMYIQNFGAGAFRVLMYYFFLITSEMFLDRPDLAVAVEETTMAFHLSIYYFCGYVALGFAANALISLAVGSVLKRRYPAVDHVGSVAKALAVSGAPPTGFPNSLKRGPGAPSENNYNHSHNSHSSHSSHNNHDQNNDHNDKYSVPAATPMLTKGDFGYRPRIDGLSKWDLVLLTVFIPLSEEFFYRGQLFLRILVVQGEQLNPDIPANSINLINQLVLKF